MQQDWEMKPRTKDHFGFSMVVAGLVFLAATSFIIIPYFILLKRRGIPARQAAGPRITR